MQKWHTSHIVKRIFHNVKFETLDLRISYGKDKGALC